MTEDKGEPEENLDGFLQYFVRLVNRSGLEIGITLNVSGLTISGQLISSKSYFEGLIQEMSSANTDNQVKLAFQEAFRKIGGIYSQMDDEDDERKSDVSHLISTSEMQRCFLPVVRLYVPIEVSCGAVA